jgi:fructuronate reductase
MQRLTPGNMSQLPPAVRLPRYDRTRLAIGIAHIGVGAFHRCHQAEYTDDMLETAFGPWGVVGINIRPPRLAACLGPQHGLYTRTLKRAPHTDTRLIGCIKATIDVESPASAQAAVAALAAPTVSTITLTLTEKGYCHNPATGALDLSNASLTQDLKSSGVPATALGLLIESFEQRISDNAGPVTVLSCDNIPSNGRVLQRVLTEFAAASGSAAANWISQNVACPSSMVDRIVPAATQADIDFVANRLGVLDRAAVIGEPFRQWVIEDSFASRRPPWDLAGAQFVSDVEPYEKIKMRVLNAAQSTLSHLGPFLGHVFSHQAITDPLLANLVRRMLVEETASTLPQVEGMGVANYIETTFERIGNTAIQHRCHQIGTDGSQKIVQRILNPMRERVAAGRPARLLTLAAASWIAYVLAGAERFGRRWGPDDPYGSRLLSLAKSSGGDLFALTRQILSIEPIFGAAPPSSDLCIAVAGHLEGLLSGNPRNYLASVLVN